MTYDSETWGPPLAVLGLAVVLGIGLAARMRRSDPAGVTREAAIRAAEVDRAVAIDALRQLDLDAAHMDPDVVEAERARWTARGAAALRALDQGAGPDPRHAAARAKLGDVAWDAAVAAGSNPDQLADAVLHGPAATGAAWRGALLALACVAIVAGLAVYAGEDAKPRRDDMGTPGTPPIVAKWEAALQADPNNLEALVGLTDVAIRTGDAKAAMTYNQRALTADPTHVAARTQKAVLAAMVGMFDNALARLDEVLADAPDHVDALVYRGVVCIQLGRPGDAIVSLERATQLAPSNPEIRRWLDQARGGSAPGAPSAPAASPPAPAGTGDVVVSGTVSLASGANAEGTLYVSVRDPAGGPPLAARKLPAGPFPMAFEVRTSDAIAMGGARPFPAVIDLTVRIDRDGNAMTKDPSEPVANLPGTPMGTTGLNLEMAVP